MRFAMDLIYYSIMDLCLSRKRQNSPNFNFPFRHGPGEAEGGAHANRAQIFLDFFLLAPDDEMIEIIKYKKKGVRKCGGRS
jgi:hypothetical protein